MSAVPLVVKTRHIARARGIRPQTVNNHRLAGKLPPFDFDTTRQSSGWNRETIKSQAPKIYTLLVGQVPC